MLPRAWSADVPADASDQDLVRRLGAWSTAQEARGTLRCGVGEVAREDGTRVVAAVQVDARARLAPVPLAPEVGQAIVLRAEIDVPATDFEVVVLPPQGRPRTLAAQHDGMRLSAKVRLDQAGPWVVQILANDDGGPLPVLSMALWPGGPPRTASEAKPVPGEDAAAGAGSPEDALFAMSNAARASVGLGALERNASLDALAERHAELMREQGSISHDAGDGAPSRRVEARGIRARSVGENVARAPAVGRVHRALWLSPSHRGNLLFPHFDEVGIGVSQGADGQLYAALLFIDSR